jgi:16S rRNA processing protein RimM
MPVRTPHRPASSTATPNGQKSDPLVLVGAVVGAFGVRGEVRVRSFTAEPAALFSYGPLLGDSGSIVLDVRKVRPVPDGFAVECPQLTTREQAQALRGTRLHVPRTSLPDPDEDEYYHIDLIGLAVESLEGTPLGRVRQILAGPQDLVEIHQTPGVSASWYLPFTRALVPVVDLAAGRLIADVPLGLIPDPQPAPDAALEDESAPTTAAHPSHPDPTP